MCSDWHKVEDFISFLEVDGRTSVPQWQPPRAVEIDKKLRDDFRRMLRDHAITTQETDPILAVLFRSQAAQLEDVYDQAAESIPLAVLDELMAGLGMPERRSQPAQTIIRFTLKDDREQLAAGTELIGEAASREKLVFALDTGIEVSPAEIGLVAIYQDGSLRLHPGTQLAKEFEEARPSFEPVNAELGPNPAIFIAIDVDVGRHLSNHGLYFELIPEAKDLLTYLQRETWSLLDDEGQIHVKGLLRPTAGNAGVRMLEWLSTPKTEAGSKLLPGGFYGARVFILPEIPPERGFIAKVPVKMEAPLKRIFQTAGKDLFNKRRAWLRIGLPREARTITEDIVRIVLHCTTASNIEVLNQTIYFENEGTSIPLNGGGRVRHLVKPISIKGESGSEYLHEADPTATEHTGRYRFRRERLEIEPARTVRGISDNYANVRLLLSNGQLANGVNTRAVTTFLKKVSLPALKFTNLTGAAGGTDGESFAQAQNRFSELLLSRERAVTYADLQAIVKAFEPRVHHLNCLATLERTPDGLRRVQKVIAALDRQSFTAPDEESMVLQRELEAHLQERAMLGLNIRVAIEWI